MPGQVWSRPPVCCCFDCDPPCRGSAGPMLSHWTHWRLIPGPFQDVFQVSLHNNTPKQRHFSSLKPSKTLNHSQQPPFLLSDWLICDILTGSWNMNCFLFFPPFFSLLIFSFLFCSRLLYSTLTEPVCVSVLNVSILDFVSPSNTNIDAPTQTSSLSFSLFLIFFLFVQKWIRSCSASVQKNKQILVENEQERSKESINLNVAAVSSLTLLEGCWWFEETLKRGQQNYK